MNINRNDREHIAVYILVLLMQMYENSVLCSMANAVDIVRVITLKHTVNIVVIKQTNTNLCLQLNCCCIDCGDV